MAVNRRLNKEYKAFQDSPLDWAKVSIPDESNMLKWKATITGLRELPMRAVFSLSISPSPKNTPSNPLRFDFFFFFFFFFSSLFSLPLSFSNPFPFSFQKILFVTQVYHPNINPENGQFCAEVLRARWSPQLTIQNVLITLRNLLSDPNLGSYFIYLFFDFIYLIIFLF